MSLFAGVGAGSASAGLACGVLSAAAYLVARPGYSPGSSSRGLFRRSWRVRSPVARAPLPPILVAELVAAAVESGASPETALKAVRQPAPPEVADALRLAQRTGLMPAALIRAAGVEAQRLSHDRAALAANRLPVRLVLPSGLCLLPAALLIGVVPVVLDLLAQVLRSTP